MVEESKSTAYCKETAQKIKEIVERNRKKAAQYDNDIKVYNDKYSNWQNKKGEYSQYSGIGTDTTFRSGCEGKGNAVCWNGPDNWGWRQDVCKDIARSKGLYRSEQYTTSGAWDHCYGGCGYASHECRRPQDLINKDKQNYENAKPQQPNKPVFEQVPVFNCCEQNLQIKDVGGDTNVGQLKLINDCVFKLTTNSSKDEKTDDSEADDGEDVVDEDVVDEDDAGGNKEDDTTNLYVFLLIIFLFLCCLSSSSVLSLGGTFSVLSYT